MEEKINILKKMYMSKEIPSDLEYFDVNLLGVQDNKSEIFKTIKFRTFIYTGGILAVFALVSFSLLSFFPQHSVTKTIKGTLFKSRLQETSETVPSVVPSQSLPRLAPSPTPTLTPTPTVTKKSKEGVESKETDEEEKGSNVNKNEDRSDEENSEKESDDGGRVQGARDEHRRSDEDRNKDDDAQSENSNSGKSKKD